MKNSTIVIIVVVVLVLLIGIGVYVAYANAKAPVVVTPTPLPAQNANSGLLTTVFDLIKGLFNKKETLPPYVQVPPIDSDGCDANGFNKIGIHCSIGGF